MVSLAVTVIVTGATGEEGLSMNVQYSFSPWLMVVFPSGLSRKSGAFHDRNCPKVVFHSNDALSAPNPVITGSSPMPGVDDMTGEYNRGDALSVTAVNFMGAEGADEAEMTLHFPCTQPHRPTPQSSGPSQLAVHMRLQGFFTGTAVQPDG
jgi:hypothetical protein